MSKGPSKSKDDPIEFDVWLPWEILQRKGLTLGEKALLAAIVKLYRASKKNECYASNDYFSRWLGVHPKSISRWVTGLHKKGLVDRKMTYKPGTKEVDKRYLTPKLNVLKIRKRKYRGGNNLRTPPPQDTTEL